MATDRDVMIAETLERDARRMAELEALLLEAKYILANNAAEGDQQAGELVEKINRAVKR